MSFGYLLDEHVPRALKAGLVRRDVLLIEVWRVGEPGAPPRGSPDPVLLDWCEVNNCILVTNNRKSMPRHLADHLARGRRVPGILVLDVDLSFAQTLEDLLLIAGASLENEHENQIRHLPLTQ